MNGRPVLSIPFAQSNAGPRIHLARSGQRFTIAVRPCLDDQPSLAEFSGYIEARTAARSLRRQHGWRIVDEVDAATKRTAEDAEAARIEAKRWGVPGGQTR